MYLDTPVSVLDYGSLYPSSMIAENISHDTFIPEEEYEDFLDKGYTINTINYEVDGIPTKNYYVTKDPEGKPIKGLMPIILEKLLKERKDTRKKIGYQTVVLNNNPDVKYSGLYSEKDETFTIYNIDEGENILENEPISNIKEKYTTHNEF